MDHQGIKIRNATQEEMNLFLEWANNESWNVAEADSNAFYHTDPHGFFLAELNEEPVAMVSAVTYDNYAHIGFYIVKKEFRGKGYGFSLFQHACKYAEGKVPVLGLDGVEQQKGNYEKSEFKAFDTLSVYKRKAQGVCDKELLDIRDLELEEIVGYDEKNFGSSRRKYLEAILQQKVQGLVIKKDGEIKGYGILKKAHSGYKVSPLVAENKEFALQILNGLQSLIEGENISLCVFGSNEEAKSLVQDWEQVTTLHRMYKNGVPKNNSNKLFGNIPEIA